MDITVDELKERRDKGEKINLIDVREQYEFDEFNLGGTLIPLGTLPASLEQLGDLKNEEVIVHCKSGGRSGTAKQFLSQHGFTKVRNLLGGVMEWQKKFGR
jgi:rhodanese-related sulfurtransferase